MKNQKHFFVALVCILCFLSSYAQTTIETRKAAPFNEIHMGGGIDVVFTNGDYSIKVEAEPAIIPQIETIVDNGILQIKPKQNAEMRTEHKIVVHVSAPDINNVLASGGSDFFAESLTTTKTFSYKASGGSDVEISNLKSPKVELIFSGGSDVKVNNLEATDCILLVSGGSDANIGLNTATVDAKASGGSDINLSGKTKHISIACSGGSDGDIKKLSYETINTNASGSSDISK